jgi:hypothetical protein
MENHLYRSKSYFSGQNLMMFCQKEKLWNLGIRCGRGSEGNGISGKALY